MAFSEVLFFPHASAMESLARDPTRHRSWEKNSPEAVNVLLVPPSQGAYVDETLGSFSHMSTGISSNTT